MTIVKHTVDEMKKMASKTDWKRIDSMTDEELTRAALSDPDTPPLTDADFAKMRPASDVHPEIVEAYKRTRGKQKAKVKDRITIRLNHEVVVFFKAQGKGWQTKINDILDKYVDSHRAT